MPKRTILYIITKSVWGGAAKYVYDLATHLPKDRFKVQVAAGGRDKFAHVLKNTADIPYFEIKSFQRTISPLKDITAFFEILRLLFKLHPDIIHANSSKAGGIAGLASWVYKKIARPSALLVFTAHGWAFAEDRPKWQIALIKLFSRISAWPYDKIICVSEYDRKIALKAKTAPAAKLVTVHNGINTQTTYLNKPEARSKLGCTGDEFVIGTVAEWTKNKGLKYLVEAADLLVKSKPALKLKIVLIGSGENPDKKQLQSLIARHKLEPYFVMRDWLDNVTRYFRAFDIFVLPSVKEGLPYTVLEAMLANLPVIATTVGGIPEIIDNGSNGILIKPKHNNELSEAVSGLLDSDIRQLIGASARHKIIQEFALEKMVAKTAKVYFSAKNY